MESKMLKLVMLMVCFTSLQSIADDKISADQLEGLSDCDYFKYTECTSANLNIGACVKKKYQGFVKACGKVHADKFLYSREMYKPEKRVKSKDVGCEEATNTLCVENGLSLEACSSKYKKEMTKACGNDFVSGAKGGKESECFELRKKYCGNEVTIECDEIFEAKAPAHCKSAVPSSKKGKAGALSDKAMLDSCMGTITKACKMPSDEELLKEGSNVSESMRKYQVCVQRAVMKSTGKCGSIIPDKEKIIKEKNKK